MAALRYADYVFANELEVAAWSKAFDLETDSHTEIAKHIARTFKVNEKRARTVIITDGPKPIVVVTNMPMSDHCDVQEFPVEALSNEEIIDTNGAGDAFVGGFYSQLFQGKDIATCVKAGIQLSREIVKRSGCTFPESI